jgi:hypothetical protein
MSKTHDMRPQVAWCWASGLIEIGDKLPDDDAAGGGAILIASGPQCELVAILGVLARHGKGTSAGKLLVPGVPEADHMEEAADALSEWLDWCSKRNGKKNSHGVEFVHGATK